MNTSFLAYIWQYTKNQQTVVIILTILSFPILYLSLEIPKIIVNETLSGELAVRSLFGIEIEVIPYLVVLCLGLLLLIIANGVLKMRINTLKGIIGERLVRRLRYQLIDQMLRFPLPHFSRVSQGELVATVTGEAEPLAGYISESIALPLFQGGTMLTILFFMFMQDWVFGVASVALIPLQAYIIPKLQAQVNDLKKERVKRIRKLSERIGETVSGAMEIRLQGTQPYTLAEFSHWFGSLFSIRFEIFKKKFFMKFLNNTIGQLTPFMFYLFGGILVIRGEISIGALVASLSAYKDLTSPWKELLNHYQAHEDAKIKYQQIHEQFSPKGLLPPQNSAGLVTLPTLKQPFVLNNVSWKSETGEPIISGASARFEPGTWTIITSQNAMQRLRLAHLITGLEPPYNGSITIGDTALNKIDPVALRGKLAYQGPDPHIFSGTIGENVFYGLNRNPPGNNIQDAQTKKRLEEAVASGNSPFDYFKSWIDFGLTDAHDEQEMAAKFLQSAAVIGVDSTLYHQGLHGVIDPQSYPALAEDILHARIEISQRIKQAGLEDIVSVFDPETYNRNATVAENVLFGIADSDSLQTKHLAENSYLQKTLSDTGVVDDLLEIGAKSLFRISARISETNPATDFLNQFELNDDDEVRELLVIADQYLESATSIDTADKSKLLNIALNLIPQKHKFGFINESIAARLLSARHAFHQNIRNSLDNSIIQFDKKKYHPKLTVLDNLLYGRVVATQPAHEKKISRIIEDVLVERGIKDNIMLLLIESQVGIQGTRLPLIARHRISISRSIMKAPDVFVIHDALAPLESADKRQIRINIKKMLPDSTFICIDSSVEDESLFDQVIRLEENGSLRDARDLRPGQVETSDENIVLIGQSRILGVLDAEKQQLLAENSQRITVEAGEFVYRFGDQVEDAYLIINGKAASLGNASDSESVVAELSQGDGFGIIEIIAQRKRMLSIKAKTNMEILRVNGQTIRELMDNDIQVVHILLRMITDQWATGYQ